MKRLEPWPGTDIVLISRTRHLTLKVPLSTHGRVVRQLVSANPGLKVNQSTNFSSIKMFLTAYVFCGLSLVKLKAEGQTVETESVIEKLQYSDQNCW